MIDAVLSREERRVILVDGFNVLHAVLQKAERESGWWKREQRERLLRRVAKWPTAQDEVWVAFDGTQPAWSVWAEPIARIPAQAVSADSQPGMPALSRPVPVHSVYVESADDWIVRRARRAPHPERTIVVTRDRQVAGRARSAGCEVWSPWSFMSRCPDGESDASIAAELAAGSRATSGATDPGAKRIR